MDTYDISPGAFVVMPCSNARYCGNTATTTRPVPTAGVEVEMCEPCATEYDENLS